MMIDEEHVQYPDPSRPSARCHGVPAPKRAVIVPVPPPAAGLNSNPASILRAVPNPTSTSSSRMPSTHADHVVLPDEDQRTAANVALESAVAAQRGPLGVNASAIRIRFDTLGHWAPIHVVLLALMNPAWMRYEPKLSASTRATVRALDAARLTWSMLARPP